MARTRHPRAPAPEGTWERCVESVACHEADACPRITLLVPTLIALIMGFVFSLQSNITAAPGVKLAFSAIAFTVAALLICIMLAGLPVFRGSGGCVGGCAEIAHAAAACVAPPPPPPRDVVPEFELPRVAARAAGASAADDCAASGGSRP